MGSSAQDREVLAAGLRALGFSVATSQTNFLLAQAPENVAAESLYQDLKASGILVRYFAAPRLRDCLRITVGTPEQNAQLLSQLGAAEKLRAKSPSGLVIDVPSRSLTLIYHLERKTMTQLPAVS